MCRLTDPWVIASGKGSVNMSVLILAPSRLNIVGNVEILRKHLIGRYEVNGLPEISRTSVLMGAQHYPSRV